MFNRLECSFSLSLSLSLSLSATPFSFGWLIDDSFLYIPCELNHVLKSSLICGFDVRDRSFWYSKSCKNCGQTCLDNKRSSVNGRECFDPATSCIKNNQYNSSLFETSRLRILTCQTTKQLFSEPFFRLAF